MPAFDETRVGNEMEGRGVAGEILPRPGSGGNDDLPPQVLAFWNEMKGKAAGKRPAESFAMPDLAGKHDPPSLRRGPGRPKRRPRRHNGQDKIKSSVQSRMSHRSPTLKKSALLSKDNPKAVKSA